MLGWEPHDLTREAFGTLSRSGEFYPLFPACRGHRRLRYPARGCRSLQEKRGKIDEANSDNRSGVDDNGSNDERQGNLIKKDINTIDFFTVRFSTSNRFTVESSGRF